MYWVKLLIVEILQLRLGNAWQDITLIPLQVAHRSNILNVCIPFFLHTYFWLDIFDSLSIAVWYVATDHRSSHRLWYYAQLLFFGQIGQVLLGLGHVATRSGERQRPIDRLGQHACIRRNCLLPGVILRLCDKKRECAEQSRAEQQFSCCKTQKMLLILYRVFYQLSPEKSL